jgi:hypothetical protein
MRARSRFGIAIAAMIKMIATTINNSIKEKPFCFLFIVSPRSISSIISLVLYSLAGYALMYRKGDASVDSKVYFPGTITLYLLLSAGYRPLLPMLLPKYPRT